MIWSQVFCLVPNAPFSTQILYDQDVDKINQDINGHNKFVIYLLAIMLTLTVHPSCIPKVKRLGWTQANGTGQSTGREEPEGIERGHG